MPRSAGYVSPQYLKNVAAAIRPFKVKTYDLMNIKNGDRILDIGCGPGIDTIELTKYVGISGNVFGMDIDEEMIDLANKEADIAGVTNRVQHVLGTIEKLPFEDNYFDSIRAERLFQVIPPNVDRNALFSEIRRVLKPDARAVLIDTDWATSSVDFSDIELERKLITFFSTRLRPDGFAGRSFKRYFLQNNFSDISIESLPVIQKKVEETPFGEWLSGAAVNEKIISPEQAEFWIKELSQKTLEGTFFSSVSSIVATGKKTAQTSK